MASNFLVALTPAQARVVATTLQRVEKGLKVIDRLLVESASEATYCFGENLTGQQRAGIRHLCRRIQGSVAKASVAVRAEPKHRSLPRETHGEADALQAVLETAKSAALRGSGPPLGREEGTVIDAALQESGAGLAEMLRNVAPAVRGKPGASPAESSCGGGAA